MWSAWGFHLKLRLCKTESVQCTELPSMRIKVGSFLRTNPSFKRAPMCVVHTNSFFVLSLLRLFLLYEKCSHSIASINISNAGSISVRLQDHYFCDLSVTHPIISEFTHSPRFMLTQNIKNFCRLLHSK